MLRFSSWPPERGNVSFAPEARQIKTREGFEQLGRFTAALLLENVEGETRSERQAVAMDIVIGLDVEELNDIVRNPNHTGFLIGVNEVVAARRHAEQTTPTA